MSSSDHYGLLVTFEGPFDVTSNKHLASWAGAATATSAAFAVEEAMSDSRK